MNVAHTAAIAKQAFDDASSPAPRDDAAYLVVLEHDRIGLHAVAAAARDESVEIDGLHAVIAQRWQCESPGPVFERGNQGFAGGVAIIERSTAQQYTGLCVLQARGTPGRTRA